MAENEETNLSAEPESDVAYTERGDRRKYNTRKGFPLELLTTMKIIDKDGKRYRLEKHYGGIYWLKPIE